MTSTAILFLLLLPIITTLILPMTNSGGQPDMTSFTKHMLLMEKTINSLQSQVLTTNSQLATVQSKLDTTENELRNVIAELRLAETDIKDLKTELQKHPDSDEFSRLKIEVAALTARQNALVDEMNLTVHGSLNNSVKSNTDELQMMKSQLLETITQMNTTSQDLNSTRAEYNTLQSKQHRIEQDLTVANATVQSTYNDMKVVKSQISTLQSKQQNFEQDFTATKATVQSTSTDMKVVKSQISTLSSDATSFRQQLSAYKTKLDKDVAFQITQRGLGHTGWTILKFDTVDYNTGNGYNKTTGIFTAPTSGTYILWANVEFDSPVGYNFINIQKGLNKLTAGESYVETSGHSCGVYPTVTTHLDVGDQVHFTTLFTSSYIRGTSFSSYGGALLHAS